MTLPTPQAFWAGLSVHEQIEVVESMDPGPAAELLCCLDADTAAMALVKLENPALKMRILDSICEVSVQHAAAVLLAASARCNVNNEICFTGVNWTIVSTYEIQVIPTRVWIVILCCLFRIDWFVELSRVTRRLDKVLTVDSTV
eukprot:6103162-Pyramimonas_sp.AAC.1